MSREKEGYRDNLERIIAAVPDRECLKKGDVKRITGWDYKTIAKRLQLNKWGEITRADLARQLSA